MTSEKYVTLSLTVFYGTTTSCENSIKNLTHHYYCIRASTRKQTNDSANQQEYLAARLIVSFASRMVR